MPRFVVLSHDWPFPHLDLLLEADGVLKAWRLPADFSPDVPASAEQNADHRLHYLEHVGPVSGGRGTVTCWDAGELVWETREADRVVVRFAGEKLRGRYELVREGEAWRFFLVSPPRQQGAGNFGGSPLAGAAG